jgi:glycolate oxidase FAD binding subunit
MGGCPLAASGDRRGVGGVTATTRSAPTTALAPSSAAEAREMVREARAERTPLRLAGRGTWLDAGRPVRAARTLSLAGLSGIVDYVPGDLTLTARAGTTLAEIERATAAEGQWLTLDPFGEPDGTLGATVATASAGPLAHLFGTPRDLVLGLEFVDGRAALVRGGGRVVKNVAGFDLVRLLVGSWGTLGAITEVSVRLRALPEVQATVALPLRAGASLASAAAALRAVPLAAYAIEALGGRAARAIGLGDGDALLVRLGGNEALVRAERAALSAIGEVIEVDDGAWARLRRVEPAAACVVRISALPSRLPALWSAASAALAGSASGTLHATVGRGVVRCIAGAEERDAVERLLASLPADVVRIPERLDAGAWERIDPPAGDRLSHRVRDAFDPDRLLNAGILGEDAR